MNAVRTPRPGGAVASGPAAGSGGNFSAGHVLNGEPSGSTRPGHPLVPAGSTTPEAG